MKHVTPFLSINDSNPASEILEMVFRKAPLFMRAHLGNTPHVIGYSGQALPRQVRESMRRRVADGADMHDVARDLGVHYQTVVRNTRDLRHTAPAAREEVVAA